MFNNRVNRVLGRVYGLQGLPTEQLPYIIGIFVILAPIFLLDPFMYFFATISVFLGWLVITKKDPQRVLEKLRLPRKWRSFQPQCVTTKAGLPKASLPKAAFYLHKGKKMHWTEKNHETCLTIFVFPEDESLPAAYGHQRGTEAMFIFGWRLFGHDPSATGDIAKSALHGVFNGLKALPFGVDLKFVEASFIDDSGYRKQQEKLAQRPGLTWIERALIAAKLRRAQDMTSPDPRKRSAGHMQSKTLYVYAKYRVQFGSTAGFSNQTNAISRFFSTFSSVLGIGVREPNVSQWERVAKSAFDNCFTPLNAMLSSSINYGFVSEPLTKDTLWEVEYSDTHPNSEVPPVPQYVSVDRDGISLPVFNDDTHILGVLHTPENGYPPTIQAERAYVYVPTLDKYVGFVKVGGLDKIVSFPMVNENTELGLYLFWHNILAGNTSPFTDYKIILEYTRDYSNLEIVNCDRTITGAVQQQATAMRRNSVNVVAKMIEEEALEARQMLEQDNPPGWVSLVVAVYRDSPEELSNALQDLVRRMPTANSEIATEVTEYIWNQLPAYTWEALLSQPEHRRKKYFATETVPQIPFVTAPGLDKQGVMLLHTQLRSPLYIDICNKNPNFVAIIAETGAGKSVLTFDMIFEALCYSYPAIVFEFPRPDGKSTYTEFIEILRILGKRVVYLDIRKNRVNILEKPGLSHIDRETPEGREKLEAAYLDIETGQIELIATLILGAAPDPQTEEDVKDWLRRTYAAFNADPVIKADYEVAIAGGFGSEDYLRMPNLTRFSAFAREWLTLQIEHNPTIYDGSRRAIDKIINRFLGVLESPLGRSLDGPSTFDMDVDFMVLSLTDVAADADSLVYAMVGLQMISRKAISSNHSNAFIEEATTLYQMRPFARRVSAMPPTARKLGLNCVFVFQSIQTVFDAGYGPQLFNNIQNILMSAPNPGIIREVVQYLGFQQKMAESFQGKTINPKLLETYWYCLRGTRHIPLTYCPPKLLVALAANDTEEVDARNRAREAYGNPNDPTDLAWLIKFSELYYEARRKGLEMDTICPSLIHGEKLLCA